MSAKTLDVIANRRLKYSHSTQVTAFSIVSRVNTTLAPSNSTVERAIAKFFQTPFAFTLNILESLLADVKFVLFYKLTKKKLEYCYLVHNTSTEGKEAAFQFFFEYTYVYRKIVHSVGVFLTLIYAARCTQCHFPC